MRGSIKEKINTVIMPVCLGYRRLSQGVQLLVVWRRYYQEMLFIEQQLLACATIVQHLAYRLVGLLALMWHQMERRLGKGICN